MVPCAVAFHVLVTAVPEGRVSPVVQPLSGVEPAVTRTVATKPPFHWLSVTEALHPAPVGGVVGGVVGVVVGGVVGVVVGGVVGEPLPGVMVIR
ncbi:hypothetical protein Afe05nite_78510 [Paractinoplanes ferrugineus]|uniref:Uncharacterized protein n=1 Tax=Paractinoplanes ferrugineus TaxID=113564 RepID=A0A919JF24_9ACTN|nr:hypothetical protein Afe05nite_78510 [Actinoplanes ferrugineus]